MSQVARPHSPRLDATLALVLGALASACSGSDEPASDYPYEADTTRVIGAGGTSQGGSSSGSAGTSGASSGGGTTVGVAAVGEYQTPDADQCLEFLDGCARPQEGCGDDGTADVIVGQDGEVLSVVCYPNRDYEVVHLPDQVEAPVLGNNQVIVLDGADDGDDVIGDLTVEGNNVIIFGEGPDTSVIGGDLAIDKNNAIVRGVRIGGNTTISKNNASLIHCVIEGDLTITGNNVNLALCDIFGDVTISGNNTVFVSNRVAGEQPIEGVNLRCNDNWRFTDDNGDARVDDAEVGEPVQCLSRGNQVEDDADLRPRNSPRG